MLFRSKQRSNQYEHIRIEVEDNGYGMTPEYLKTIFDAFTRAENSTTNKVQGTGLGMAITKSIVELMGGTIEVFSQVDKGSLFRVELELRIPEHQADRQFWKQNGIARIMAVAPDKETCEGIQTLMINTGVQVEMVHTLREAMELAADSEGEPIHLVLLDWPDAREAAKLRGILPEHVPILLLQEYDIAGGTAVPLANSGILTKPFFESALKEKIQEMNAAANPARNPASGEVDCLTGLHFLAAEDNEINAEILNEILKMEGASCEIVENGQLAVERFTQTAAGTFDAILMDVQMPVLNGYDATRAIRTLERKDAQVIPIIAMTANAFAEDEKAALDSGMNAHVAKPVDVGLLKKVLRQHIKRKD